MSDYIKTVSIWLIAIVCIIFTINYITANVDVNNQNSYINETLQTSLLANQEYSERVEPKAFYIDKPEFEKSFVSRYKTDKDSKIRSIEFSYLPSKYSTYKDAISGVKVKLITTDSEMYQGTLLIDNGKIMK